MDTGASTLPMAAGPPNTPARPGLALLLVAVASCAASLWLAWQTPVNDDDVYHLHSIWLTANGYVPYRQFFEMHLPGMWLAAGPLARAGMSGASLVLAGRALIAILFGAIILLGGRVVRARGWQACLLGALGLLVLQRCEFFLFRAEYLAAFLVFVHYWLLARDRDPARDPFHEFLAAAAMALACTMSMRPVVLLLVQPALLLLDRRTPGVRARAGMYVLGMAAGALPVFLFLCAHGLWADCWFWGVRFTASEKIVYWQWSSPWRYAAIAAAGLCGLALIHRDGCLPERARRLLDVAWPAALLFYVINPLRMPFSNVHFLLLSAAVAAAAVEALSERAASAIAPRFGPPLRRAIVGAALVAALAAAAWKHAVPLTFDRQDLRLQLELIDWLESAAGGEPVVLVAPHHPIAAPDCTDVQNAWHYCYWLDHPAIRQRMASFASQVLRTPPPVIAADPWASHTGHRNLVEWLTANRIIAPQDASALESLISERYVEISFPALAHLPYGSAFWVRKDRLQKAPPPEPHNAGPPRFAPHGP